MKAYEQDMHVQVQTAGLFLHSSGLISASPDGLVGDEKSTWSDIWDTRSMKESLQDKNFFLQSRDGIIELRGEQGSKYMHVQVQSAGLFLHSSGLMGASPHGLVGDERVLVVKCPWKVWDTKSLEEALQNNNFFLQSKDGIIVLRREQGSKYYHQIQSQLYLTGRNMCQLYMWTLTFRVVLEIPRDQPWKAHIKEIQDLFMWTAFFYVC